MTLIKFKNEPASGMMDRSPMFDNLFNDFFGGLAVNQNRSLSPSVNIIETDENFKLELAAPGLTKDDFKVNIENDLLTVSAEKKSEENEKTEKYTRKEFSFTSFKRAFTLPDFTNAEKIGASYENGILVLVIPKKEEAKPKPAREIKIA